jgi:hypothetical protein
MFNTTEQEDMRGIGEAPPVPSIVEGDGVGLDSMVGNVVKRHFMFNGIEAQICGGMKKHNFAAGDSVITAGI